MDLGLDLTKMAPEPQRSAPQGIVKKLSMRHHNLARCLAQGTKPGEAAVMVGYTATRVSVLQSDPAFKELVAFYATRVDEEFSLFQERMATLGLDALDALQERLEDDPDAMSTTHLLQIVEKTADRTGNGPQSTSQHLHLHAGTADALKLARERVTKMQTLDLEIVDG